MIIYKATNKINGKIYIGQTINTLSQRISVHICDAKRGSNVYFARAIRKYGFKNFKWEELCCCFDMDGLNEMEVYFIALYDSFENGYNLTSGGENCLVSDKTKEKLRQINLGKKLSEETKERIRQANLGSKRTAEQKENMRIAQLNISDETKEKISIANSGENNGMWGKFGTKHHFYGKKHTPKTIERMRQAKLGKKHSDTTKQKMSEVQSGKNNHFYGKHHSDETKEKNRQSHIGKKFSDETRQKMSVAQLKHWQKIYAKQK